jgi:hypothetical protein
MRKSDESRKITVLNKDKECECYLVSCQGYLFVKNEQKYGCVWGSNAQNQLALSAQDALIRFSLPRPGDLATPRATTTLFIRLHGSNPTYHYHCMSPTPNSRRTH